MSSITFKTADEASKAGYMTVSDVKTLLSNRRSDLRVADVSNGDYVGYEFAVIKKSDTSYPYTQLAKSVSVFLSDETPIGRTTKLTGCVSIMFKKGEIFAIIDKEI